MIPYAPQPTNGMPFTTPISAYPDTQCIVVYNESPYFMNFEMVGSDRGSIPAYTADVFEVKSGFTGTLNFNPYMYLAASALGPASVVFIQAYGSNDALTRLVKSGQATGYPISLSRLFNIGNGGSVGGSSTLINTGNAPLTNVVTIQPSDAASATTLGDNSGNWSFFGDNAGVLTLLLQLVAGATPLVKLLGGIQINANGNIIMPNNSALEWLDNASAIKPVLNVDTLNKTLLTGVVSGQDIQIRDRNGTVLASFNINNGIQFNRAINNNPATVSITGGLAGTATLVQDFIGETKRATIYLNGFKTGASNQTIALPTAFSGPVRVKTGGTGSNANPNDIQLLKAGTPQTINILTGLGAGGGTFSSATSIFQFSEGECNTGCDTIQFIAGNTTAHTGMITLEGQ